MIFLHWSSARLTGTLTGKNEILVFIRVSRSAWTSLCLLHASLVYWRYVWETTWWESKPFSHIGEGLPGTVDPSPGFSDWSSFWGHRIKEAASILTLLASATPLATTVTWWHLVLTSCWPHRSCSPGSAHHRWRWCRWSSPQPADWGCWGRNPGRWWRSHSGCIDRATATQDTMSVSGEGRMCVMLSSEGSTVWFFRDQQHTKPGFW